MRTEEELELLKKHLFNICGMHDDKNVLLNKAIADAKSLYEVSHGVINRVVNNVTYTRSIYRA